MGGNLVLKMAGELGADAPDELRAVGAVAPALDLAACADALAEPRNFIYERHFVKRLKRRMRLKASLFPELFPMAEMEGFEDVGLRCAVLTMWSPHVFAIFGMPAITMRARAQRWWQRRFVYPC